MATVRTYAEECSYLEKVSDCSYRIKKGFVPNMKVKQQVHGKGRTTSHVLHHIYIFRLRGCFM